VTSTELARTDPPGAVALGDSRARVLAILQAADGPMGVGEIARLVGLHPNTARFHLDALSAAGLVARASEERDAPGRPRSLYAVTADGGQAGTRSYRMLAEILVEYLARQNAAPAAAAIAAGELWGRAIVEHPDPDRAGAHPGPAGLDASGATAELLRSLTGLGFAPEAVLADGERQVVMHHCPFREVADAHPDIVCGIHLGIVRGLLDELGAPLRADELEPRVAPNRCVTHLSPRG
jgi:predicted ArsR family transcriptional regulator